MRNYMLASLMINSIECDGSIDFPKLIDSLITSEGGKVGAILEKTREGRDIIRWAGYDIREENDV